MLFNINNISLIFQLIISMHFLCQCLYFFYILFKTHKYNLIKTNNIIDKRLMHLIKIIELKEIEFCVVIIINLLWWFSDNYLYIDGSVQTHRQFQRFCYQELLRNILCTGHHSSLSILLKNKKTVKLRKPPETPRR